MTEDFLQGIGRKVVSNDGEKIGTVEEVYLDQQTNQPEWALVKTGMTGGSSFVPLAGASLEPDALRVPQTKETVKGSPDVMADGELSQPEEAELYSYYGLDYSESRSDSGLPEGTPGTPGRDAGTSSTDDAMTRSEEELQIGKTQREAGRARLKKYVVTENVTQTVPVQREEVRLEREPVNEANVDAATSGDEISEDEHEVTLMEEEVVAEKRVVPKERVRLTKDSVTKEQQVSEDVRKEQIESEGDGINRS